MEAIISAKVPVQYSERPDVNRDFLMVPCPNGWDDVEKLTGKVLEFRGRDFKFSGWNSDRNEAFFWAPHGESNPYVAEIKRKS